jgi:AraC-like DNA-binding protein/ligand-binding sensor protein
MLGGAMNDSSLPSSSSQNSDRHEEVVARLQQSEIFRDYQQAFQTATGLPLVLRAAGSFQSPMQGSKQINAFCALMVARSKSCAACLQLQEQVEREAIDGCKTLQCFAGLSESVVPIRIGEKIVGYLQTGQVMLQAPTEKKFRAAMRQLKAWNADADTAQFHAAYFQTRVLTRSHYEATLRLLSSFAQHLSLVSNELMIKEAVAEPPAVAKARAFIAEHLGEPLSLTQVARAANTSAFYFCKVFKGVVGLTFTDYLARTRVEKTKQLLLNPNTRVSEAAYEAGFQSLSQFNRVFRRIAGESPSTYREQLHADAPIPSARRTLAFAA